jgi:hypothetical protein
MARTWLGDRIKASELRHRFLTLPGGPLLDELYAGEFLTLFAVSSRPM